MNQKGIYGNIGINGIHFTKAMFDNNCYSYMIISDRLQKKLQLPTLLIRLRTLEQIAETNYETINQMAYFDININDHK
jgi:hypothetical protein